MECFIYYNTHKMHHNDSTYAQCVQDSNTMIIKDPDALVVYPVGNHDHLLFKLNGYIFANWLSACAIEQYEQVGYLLVGCMHGHLINILRLAMFEQARGMGS